ncbi:UvrABC system protein A [bioreactor metagenome]|uniref:UvrABC system protein A n=1 Tax=bioreactor metagenome TaxID=1076179 RepID=A0A645HT50_9ZZZZ
MQTQGFVRFRVDGRIVEVEDLPELKRAEKHDIDVVIDRLKVRDDARQRLAESFETALRLADGFAPSLFELRTSRPLATILPQLKAAQADGLLDLGPEKIAPTAKGRRFLNVLLERFLDDGQ